MANVKMIELETYVDGELDIFNEKFDLSIYDISVVQDFANEHVRCNLEKGRNFTEVKITDLSPDEKRISFYFTSNPN